MASFQRRANFPRPIRRTPMMVGEEGWEAVRFETASGSPFETEAREVAGFRVRSGC